MSVVTTPAGVIFRIVHGVIKQAREAVLKEDLHVLRTAIDSYTMDKQKPPQALEDLIQDGYLKDIPQDPITHSTQTWVTVATDAMQSDRIRHRRHPLRFAGDGLGWTALLRLVNLKGC